MFGLLIHWTLKNIIKALFSFLGEKVLCTVKFSITFGRMHETLNIDKKNN
jgi:hypothetical protein